MASRFGAGPGTTSAGAFFQNQRPGYKPPAMGMNGAMPQPQMQPLSNGNGNGNGGPMRAVRQGSNGGHPRAHGSGSSSGGRDGLGGGGGSGKRMDRKDTKDVAWVHWRALKDFLAAWADKGASPRVLA